MVDICEHQSKGSTDGRDKNTTDTGLLTNYLSFIPTRCKLRLVKTVDCLCKIKNTLTGFHVDTEKTKLSLQRNLFPSKLIDKVAKKLS